jgi:formate/nitrite transporter FocA (FNT family)
MPGQDDNTPETRRLTAPEIFHAALENAREELRRSTRRLFFSGLAGGFTMGLTGLAVASILALLGNGSWQELAAYMMYPIGFITVIIGRQQLFTENTLYPVILVLDEHRHVGDTARLWAAVFSSNILGALLFATLATKSSALRPDIENHLINLGVNAVGGTTGHFFWSGIIGGWLIAMVAWVVTASHWTIGQLTMVWLLTFIVGIGHFSHCIVTSSEILSGVVSGAIPLSTYLNWLWPATLGNIAGGVLIVSALNYGQVRAT